MFIELRDEDNIGFVLNTDEILYIKHEDGEYTEITMKNGEAFIFEHDQFEEVKKLIGMQISPRARTIAMNI